MCHDSHCKMKKKKISLSVCSIYKNKSKLMMPKGYYLFSALLQQKALEISRVHKSLAYSANLVITLRISCPSLGFKKLLMQVMLCMCYRHKTVRQKSTGSKT